MNCIEITWAENIKKALEDPRTQEGLKLAVRDALNNFHGKITDSEMFKYTPTYTGDA